MNNNESLKPEQLFTIFFDGTLSPAQRQELVDWLKSDVSHVKQFVYAAFIHRSIYDYVYGQETQKLIRKSEDLEAIWAEEFWNALLEEEKHAPSVNLEPPDACKTEPIVVDRSHVQVAHGHVNRFAWGTAFASMAAFILLLVYVCVNPRSVSEPAAVVSDVLKFQTLQWDPVFHSGSRLFTRSGVLRVGPGVVKIGFDNGVKVVIEGPGEFEVLSYDEIVLHSGRLYASVPRRSVGFIVSTSNTKIIDLGTEFGVFSKPSGDTELHVTKGKVSLVSGLNASSRRSLVISEFQARRIREDSEVIESIAFDGDAFVQDINSKTQLIWRGQSLDLADIAGGGNGLGTGRRNVCIDLTGTLRDGVSRERLRRTRSYVPVRESAFIDGVFIPDGSDGPIPVSSAGHFYEAPATLGESYYGVFNGSILPLKTGDIYVNHTIRSRGVAYGTPEHPALMLHTNLGVTFDLDAIRKILPPGKKIRRFTAQCGIGEAPSSSQREDDYSDFYVLVDGVERFRAVDMNYLSVMKQVDVALTDRDRFLTLMTTEGKDGTLHLGWSFFAEPQLIIDGEQE